MALGDICELSYEEYEVLYDKFVKENDELLEIFVEDLDGTLAPKTINRHYRNMEFFLNGFLARNMVEPYDKVVEYIGEFLGYFFIRKCSWSTPETIKQNCASFKKFYGCMVNHGKFSKEEYVRLCSEIKLMKDVWIEDCEDYNNLDFNFYF